jgi:hypothetical protein
MVMPEIFRDDAPGFDKVTVWATLVVSEAVSGKDSVAGERTTFGSAATGDQQNRANQRSFKMTEHCSPKRADTDPHEP